MSLASLIKSVQQDNVLVAFRPSQLYSNAVGAGVYPIFAIRDGPIVALQLVGMHTAASGGATTLAFTITGGIQLDNNGVPAINGALGTVVISPLNIAGAIAAAAVGAPLTDALLHPKGFVIGLQGLLAPTFIIGTFAVSTVTMEWYLAYRKLSPRARVTLA